MTLQQIASTSLQNQPKKDLISSVQRALRILELLAHHPAGLNAKQVSQQSNINLSTCYHLLNTLIASGYTVKDPDTLLFRLSSKIGYTILGHASPAQLVQHLTPHVQALQGTTHETAYLSLWDGEEIVLSSIIESPRSVRVKTLVIGYSEGNHAMALGKAILAYMDQEQTRRYLTKRELPAFTSNTLTELAALNRHLQEVRQRGYALDLEEYLPDVHCIGAPIFDAQGQITASIAISLPATRHNANEPGLIHQVIQAGQSATRSLRILGYVGPSHSRRGEE
ncbi:MAG: IclR family transcriptional regulator [Anaerolineae bacterium]